MAGLIKFFYLFDTRGKITLCLLSILILIGSALELIGIGAVLPVVEMFSLPNPLEANDLLKWLHEKFSPKSKNQFIAWILIGVACLYIFKNIYLLWLLSFQTKVVTNKSYLIASRLFRGYLYNPYTFHLKHNSAALLRNINIVREIMHLVLFPAMVLFSEATLGLAVFILLAWVDPFSTLVILALLALLGGAYYLATRNKLTTLGELSKFHNGKTIQHVNQGLGSIKEIKILGQEFFFDTLFSKHIFEFLHSNRRYQIISQSFRFFIESLMVILVFGGMSFLLISGEDIDNMLVIFAVFTVGIVRLVPCANRITWAIATIKYGIPGMDEVVSQIKISEKFLVNLRDEEFSKKMKFEDRIELKNVTYLYENTTNPSCESVSLSIPKNSCVGLVGSTGAGKTTVSNLITGLLNPLKGEVLVDGQNIQSELRSWQMQIGYVPQSIYLTDDTIQGNVAFGVNRDSVKEDKVWKALKLAQVDNFVRDLPNQLDTIVGENGVRLSGGQRQRIGIARALYRDPQLLVLDEATAALDNETERALMDAIESLSGKKTIILIAHRLTTVKRCDVVFYLDNGRLIDSGTHESLLRKNADFKKMAQA